MMRALSVLGSTGSIGTQTLDVVRAHPQRLRVAVLSAGRNLELVARQAAEFAPEAVALADPDLARELVPRLPAGTRLLAGPDGLSEAAAWPSADTTVIGISGVAALAPTLSAIRAGKRVAFAAKEPLVAAGDLLVDEARRRGVPLLPIDSEISALFQCLQGERVDEVRRLVLTASGGPFRTWAPEALAGVTPEAALSHPTWTMGAKITIDSATLMNKGLEVIEAWRLFGVPLESIDVVVHPQSVIHSAVEFRDGSVKAQLARPDMRLPIQYAVFFPERPANPFDRLDLVAASRLDFESPDPVRFPCLRLAYEAARCGGTMTAVLNAANEVAVAAFLRRGIGFTRIPALIEGAMANHTVVPNPDLATVLAADEDARQWVRGVAESEGSGVQ